MTNKFIFKCTLGVNIPLKFYFKASKFAIQDLAVTTLKLTERSTKTYNLTKSE